MRNFTTDFKLIDLALLEIHPRVQRSLDERHVQDIVDHFNTVALNPLTVMFSTTGRHRKRWVIDGQHTMEAARRKGVTEMWCKVVGVHSNREINEIFHLLNEHVKPMSPVTSFELNAEHDSSTDDALIGQILGQCNLSVGASDSLSTIRCASTLREVYKRLGRERLAIAAALWEIIADGGSRLDAATIRAVSDVVAKYGHDELDLSEIVDAITAEFPAMKARATAQCVGTSLGQSHRHLTREILDSAFGMGVAA